MKSKVVNLEEQIGSMTTQEVKDYLREGQRLGDFSWAQVDKIVKAGAVRLRSWAHGNILDSALAPVCITRVRDWVKERKKKDKEIEDFGNTSSAKAVELNIPQDTVRLVCNTALDAILTAYRMLDKVPKECKLSIWALAQDIAKAEGLKVD